MKEFVLKTVRLKDFFCDNTKLLENTAWKPNFTLSDGIKEVIEWMKTSGNLNYFKADKYNV